MMGMFLDAKEALKQSVRIVAPKQVILNGVIAKDIEVESTAAILTGKTSAKIESLKFKALKDSVDLENALFIDKDSCLEIENLTLEEALLFNTGNLRVNKIMDLQYGMFFNTGKFETTANPVTLKDIAYFYNGSSANMSISGNAILNAGRFVNLGEIKAGGINMISSELFHNKGGISTTAFFNINSLGESVNEGRIQGNSGSVDIFGNKFEQRKELNAAKITFNTKDTFLFGETLGQEGFFHGNTQNAGNLGFQRGVIDGNFDNSGNANFERLFELIGTRSVLKTSENLSAMEIVSNAAEGVVISESNGKVLTETITSNKHLQLEADMPTLKTLKTAGDAKLLLTNKSKTPKLQKIENHGDSTFFLGNNELSTLQNTTPATIRLESNSPFEHLTSLDQIQGTAVLNGNFSKIANLTVANGAKMSLLPGSSFMRITNLYIRNDAQVDARTDTFKTLRSITNSGALILNGTQEYAGTKIKAQTGFGFVYTGESSSKLQLENGAEISVNNFDNKGKVLSRRGVEISQQAKTVTKWGNIESGGDINYKIGGMDLDLNNAFINPMTNGSVNVYSNRNVSISNIFELPSNLELQSENLNVSGRLKSKKLKVKTNKDVTLTGYIGTRETAEVFGYNFTNTSGKFESLGNMTFNLNGTLTNTGGMKEESRQIKFNYYRQSPSTKTKYFEKEGIRDSYSRYPGTTINGILSRVALNAESSNETIFEKSIDMSKLDQIGSQKELKVIAGQLNNSFGMISGGGIEFQVRSGIDNTSGFMYSRNVLQVRGKLENGRNDESPVTRDGAIDPNKPIIGRERLPIELSVYQGKKVRFGIVVGHPWKRASEGWKYGWLDVIQGYEAFPGNMVPLPVQKYPGYIFAEGDVNISSAFDTSFGTIVSARNIYIAGRNQAGRTANLVAHGNIAMAMRQVDLNQIKARAENIVVEQLKSFILGGYITPVTVSDVKKGIIVNLEKMAKPFGFALSKRLILTDSSGVPLSIVPMVNGGDREVVMRNPENIGFRPSMHDASPFIPTIPDSITAKLIRMIVTPLYGTEIGFNVNLMGILERNGRELMQSFVYSKDVSIPDGTLALVYGKEKEREAVKDGVIQKVPQRSPHLFIGNIIDEALHYLKARQEAILRSKEGDVTIRPDDFNIDAKDLSIEADQSINILSDYIYADSKKVGVNPVKIDVSGSIAMSAGKDVINRAAQLNAGNDIVIQSKHGDIKEESMEMDPVSKRIDRSSVVSQTTAFTPEMKAGGVIREIAKEGTIIQEGSLMTARKGIEFDAKKHIVNPAYTTTQVESNLGNTTSSIKMHTPKESVFEAPEILFNSQDTTLIGAQIISSRVINNGDLYAACATGTKESKSRTVSRRRFCGISIGKSTETIHSIESFFEPTRIGESYFESNGKCTLEGAVIDVLEMAIKKKDLIDKAFYTKRTTEVTRRSSGFFAPKIKGDPFFESTKALGKVVTFGDVIPSTLNVIGSGAQTLTHATMLANLSKINNPVATVSQIFLSRFVSGFGYSNVSQRTKITESIPHQTNAKVGILKVSNDRTHLEGIWDVDQAEIDTKLFTMSAPKHEIKQTTEISGFSVSFSPAALLSAAIAPGMGAALGCLPTVSMNKSSGNMEKTTYVPAKFNANRLFVQCDNAVFSGSQIRSKMIEMMVTGELSIESLRDTFKNETRDSAISASLAALASDSTHDVRTRSIQDSKLGAVPTLRIADEEDLIEKVNTVAELIGEEKFYLKVGGLLYKKGAEVGLKPDGIISKTESEKIEAGRILTDNVSETHVHKKRVINPAIGELVACMGQIDEFKQVRAQFVTKRIAEGAPMKQALEEGEKLQELLEKPEIKNSYQKVKAAEEKLVNAAEKIEQLNREIREEASEKFSGISQDVLDEVVTEFLNQSSKFEMKTAIPEYKSSTQPNITEFLKRSSKSIEVKTAVDDYNKLVRECLTRITEMRVAIQDFARKNPRFAKVAETAFEGLKYTVMVTSTVALASSVAATASISIPAAVAGAGFAMAKDYFAIPYLKEKIIEYTAKQGTTQKEQKDFKETATWIFETIEDISSVKGAVKVARNPVGELSGKFIKTHTSLDKYGEFAVALDQASRTYSKNQKDRLCLTVLEMLGNTGK